MIHVDCTAWRRRGTAPTLSIQGFSLIEAMIAGAVVAITSTAIITAQTVAVRETSRSRAKTIGSAFAQQTIDRIVNLAVVSSIHGGSTPFCQAVVSSQGPLAGGTTAGSCPSNFTVSNVPVPGTSLRAKVTLKNVTIGTAPGSRIQVRVQGNMLRSDVVIVTQIGQI